MTVLLLLELIAVWGAVAPPVSAGVADDAEEPRARISRRVRSKVSKRLQRRFLHGVFRVVLVAQEPSRQPIGRVEVGKDDVFETLAHRASRSRPTGFVTHEKFLVYPEFTLLLLH